MVFTPSPQPEIEHIQCQPGLPANIHMTIKYKVKFDPKEINAIISTIQTLMTQLQDPALIKRSLLIEGESNHGGARPNSGRKAKVGKPDGGDQ
jgi:hypothetical protein